MIQGYRLAGKACSTEEQSKKFRLMEWGPSCIGYFADDVGYGSKCEELEPSMATLPAVLAVRVTAPY